MAATTRLNALERTPALIGAPVLVVAGDGRTAPRIVHANDVAAARLGRPPLELLDRSIECLSADPADGPELERLVEAVHHRREIALTLRTTSGTAPGALALAGRPLPGEGALYLIEVREIDATPGGPERPEHDAQRRAALLELIADAAYGLRVDPDCRLVLEWTAGTFIELIGYGVDEIAALGGWINLIEPADQRLVRRRAQRLLAGEDGAIEYRIRTKSGASLWLRDRGRPQWDEAHELVIGAVCVATDVTEEKHAALRLLELRREQGALIKLIPGVVCAFDRQGIVREVAGAMAGILADRLRGGIGHSLPELIDPDGTATWRRQLERLAPDGPAVEFAFTDQADESGARYRARVSAAGQRERLAWIRPETATAGETAATAGADPYAGALLDLQSAPAMLLAPDLSVRDLNAPAERLTGWRRAATAADRRFVELIAPTGERPAVIEDLERALAGTRVTGSEAWLRLPDGQEGRVVWSFTPLRDAAGDILGVLAQGDTVAVRDDAQPIPGDDELRLKAIMDNVADGIVALDREGLVVSFSRSAEAIFGYDRDEVIGRPIATLILAGAADDRAPLELIVAAGGGEERELMARRKTGEVIPIELAPSQVGFNGDTLHILTVRDITLRKQTEETIRSLAYHDPLTGLPNRLLFNDRLSQAIERARRHRQQLAVMILDLDRFKLINDSLGLASGDQALRAVGERLLATLRRSDTVARLAGDDFLLLLPGVDGAESAAKVAQKVLDAFGAALQIDDQELHLGASIGITIYPHDGEDPETLVRNADTALYRAKEHARGSYQFYTTDMNATAFERLVLETQLRRALERAELVVHYQPQVRIADGAVVGVEALVRWFHGELGLISPAEFIPLAEDTGLILELGRWVLSTACAQVRVWHAEGFPDLCLSVNLSGRQFEQDDLVRSIAQVVEETAFAPEDLELELTESSIMRHPDQAAAKLEALDRLGIRLSIDDFGTGYSSLLHLKRFPIRTLKIDQSFIQDITTAADDAAIAQAIIALASSLRLKVIAEGVETRGQLEVLRRYRCDQMQGYLFSKPVPADEMLTLLKSGRRLVH